MKKFFFFLLIFLVIFFFLYLWWVSLAKPASSDQVKKRFVIKKGLTTAQISKKLEEENIIRSSFAFKFYVQFRGLSDKIKAGEYNLSPSDNLYEIVHNLIKGPDLIWVTLPEGLRIEEMGIKLAKDLEVQDKKAFYKEFLKASAGKEGYLFPDTYLFSRETLPSNIVSILYDNFKRKISPFEADISKSNLSLKEVVILASIIERETRTEEERPIVAGILLKRLKAGWPLQTDATVQYIVGSRNCKEEPFDCKWWPLLAKSDLGVESKFNTYKIKGLPPSPIANAGISSIKSVIYPKETSYWFYLHDKDGKIYYATSLEEHQQNINLYLK